MGITASELSQHVIRPTLEYLDKHSAAAEHLLLAIAASQSQLCASLDDDRGHGLYRINTHDHRYIWDHYLARDPDLASLVRGLASQHAFLSAPDTELIVNLRYATAIAWLLIESASNGKTLPDITDATGMAQLWRVAFNANGQLHDFIKTWQGLIGIQYKVA
ncbi:hypothetical protein WG219_10410 [Ectopseudomonas mendocina]|uniref:Uncharacterized protein n=1 Tax=Ectopseudomonas mendocina TaxID=300 RepID=A0ABZ2RU64_ECTME